MSFQIHALDLRARLLSAQGQERTETSPDQRWLGEQARLPTALACTIVLAYLFLALALL